MRKFVGAIPLLITLCFCTGVSHAQTQSMFVAPIVTDPLIDRNFANHYVVRNPAQEQKNLLFVFLPGTGGVPFVYREIANNSANLGFHTVSLTYTNNDAVNVLCGLRLDLDCYRDVRLEIIDGTDRTTLADTNRTNSIENRLIKLLIHLDTLDPAAGWGQYLTDESDIDWSKIVIAGHSQGGGHAGIIGRYKPVKRILMYAAMDYNGLLNSPANWIARPETTPNVSTPDRFRAFSHQLDEAVGFARLESLIWPAFGMTAFGPPINVDTTAPPYSLSHSLTSGRDCENYHGCIAVDIRLIFENNQPVYAPVWEYLLDNIETTLSIEQIRFSRYGVEIPRPAIGMVNKRYRLIIRGEGFDQTSRVLIDGVEVNSTLSSSSEILTELPAGKIGRFGRYSVIIKNPNGDESNHILY